MSKLFFDSHWNTDAESLKLNLQRSEGGVGDSRCQQLKGTVILARTPRDFDLLNRERLASPCPNQILLGLGLHPWDLKDPCDNDELLYEVEGFLLKSMGRTDCRVHCLGEIGLDFSSTTRRPLINKNEQQRVFIDQLKIASRSKLPVVAHVVKAHTVFLDICKSLSLEIPVMLHGFYGSPEILTRIINETAFMISLDPQILQTHEGIPRRKWAQQILSQAPLNRLLIESGNSPISDLDKLIKAIALAQGTDQDLVASEILSNSEKFWQRPLE